MASFARFVATAAYIGYAPVAPGTFGTLPAVALAPLLATLQSASLAGYLAVLAATVAVAVWAAARTAAEEGLRDPGIIVVDEIAGYLVAVAFLPATPAVLIAGFVLFRFFDIAKPPPVRQAERLPGGVGVVADDLMAGIYANAIIRLGSYWGLL
jgi:phosphatidylglycerophosphatase A